MYGIRKKHGKIAPMPQSPILIIYSLCGAQSITVAQGATEEMPRRRRRNVAHNATQLSRISSITNNEEPFFYLAVIRSQKSLMDQKMAVRPTRGLC
jgi:hypothetical protein